MDQGSAGTSDLARFALKVYASEGVPPACLLLQERAGVDVNLLLFAAYAGAGGQHPFGRSSSHRHCSCSLRRRWGSRAWRSWARSRA